MTLPCSFGYAIVTMDTVKLYMDESKLTPPVRAHLGPDVSSPRYCWLVVLVKELWWRGEYACVAPLALPGPGTNPWLPSTLVRFTRLRQQLCSEEGVAGFSVYQLGCAPG
jgi:hypothetical protein